MIFCFSYAVASDYFSLCRLTFVFMCPRAARVCLMVVFGLLAVAVLNVLVGTGWSAITKD
jgi:hypothetical protein